MQTLGNLGARYTLTWRGKVYQFAFIGDQQKSWYEKQIKQLLYYEIENDEFANENQKAEDRARFRTQCAGGEYRWGGRKWQEFYKTEKGSFYFFWMLLALDYPELKESDARAMAEEMPMEVSAITSLVFADSTIESVKGVSLEVKQEALETVYAQLMKPPDAGGIGLSMELLAKLTDKQKQGIILKMGDKEKEKKPETKEVPYTPENQKQAADLVREYARTVNSGA